MQSGAKAYAYFTDAAVVFRASGFTPPTSITVNNISYTYVVGTGGNRSDVNAVGEQVTFTAPSGSNNTARSVKDNTAISFRYPRSIPVVDNGITQVYTLATTGASGLSAVSTKTNPGGNTTTTPVTVTYNPALIYGNCKPPMIR
jgi:hypothetical protein